METGTILELRLAAPLAYRFRAGAAAADEGAEDLSAWDWARIFADGPDGPRLAEPLPAPAFRAEACPSDAVPDLALEAGDWAFRQLARAPESDGELAAAVEAFARDLWWEGRDCEGPLYVRGVFEDGRRAVQLLRRLAAAPR